MPVSSCDRAEEKVFAIVIYDYRVRAGAVRDIPPLLLEVVLVFHVQRIAVRLRAEGSALNLK